jgi:hypothetical protein
VAARTTYKDDVLPYLDRIEAWARDGATDEIICQKLNIGKSTLYKYKNEHIEFANALKKGKEDIDIKVENALLKRALGYSFEEVTKERSIDIEGNESIQITKIVTKHIVPDTTAQIFWLKNRRPEQWRDRPDFIDEGNYNNNKEALRDKLVKELKSDISD